MTDYAVPVLASLDLLQTWKFYRYFGFELVEPAETALGDFDTYNLRLRRGGVELVFERTSTDFTRDEHVIFSRNCQVRVDDLDAWYKAFAHTKMSWKTFYPRLSEIRRNPRGGADFIVVDRDANLIHVMENPPAA